MIILTAILTLTQFSSLVHGQTVDGQQYLNLESAKKAAGIVEESNGRLICKVNTDRIAKFYAQSYQMEATSVNDITQTASFESMREVFVQYHSSELQVQNLTQLSELLQTAPGSKSDGQSIKYHPRVFSDHMP